MRCEGTTQSGEQCRCRVTAPARFCHHHKPRVGRSSDGAEIAKAFYDDLVEQAYRETERIFDHGQTYTRGGIIESYELRFATGNEELGRDGIVWSAGQPSNLEKTKVYRPAIAVGQRGSPGEFQKLAKDPTWKDNHSTVVEGLNSGSLTLSVNKRVPRAKREQAKLQLEKIEGVLDKLLTRQFEREWAAALEDGFAIWEMVGDPLSKLAYRRAWTVDSWLLDEEERVWEGVSFKTSGSSGTTYQLPSEKLLLYSHGRKGMNLPGESQLRFAAPHILCKQALIKIDMQAVTSHGMGWRVIEAELGAQDAGDDEQTVEVLSAGKAADNPTLKLAPGRTLNWIGPSSTLPDFATRVAVHEAAIDKSLGARAARMEKATYANADLVDRVDRRTVRHYGDLYADFVGAELVPVIGRQLFGDAYIEPGPTAEFGLKSDGQSAAVLVQLIQQGVITPTDKDEEVIRKQFNLPPRTDKEPAQGAAEPSASVRDIKDRLQGDADAA